MTKKDIPNTTNQAETAENKAATATAYRSPALAWVAVGLTLLAWALLMCVNGYVAMAVAAVGVVAGFFALPGRSRAARNLAVTAIIACMVLLVVLAAFIIVIKVGLQSMPGS